MIELYGYGGENWKTVHIVPASEDASQLLKLSILKYHFVTPSISLESMDRIDIR